MNVFHIVGARPNFMKIAPLISALDGKDSVSQVLVHTGQHYSAEMSQLLFEDLELPKPDINLEVGSGTHGVQTGRTMAAFDEVIAARGEPDLVVVVGDVNSTIACALVAVKRGIRVAHVEAGLRSYDRGMPEEVNRVLTDQISDVLLTTEEAAAENLKKEGIDLDKVHFVGNVMIDTLLKHKDRALQRASHERYGLEATKYGVVTLHRPSNVDNPESLLGLVRLMQRVSEQLPLLWPMHPRTRDRMESMGLLRQLDGSAITIEGPLGYLDFMCCVANAGMVFTDSGGVQEETTILEVPCITVRENTERPITIHAGTNVLAGTNPDDVWQAFVNHPYRDKPVLTKPPLWDGGAAGRIAEILVPG